MAEIKHTRLVPFARHLRADTNNYIQHLNKGSVSHEGSGIAFWFMPQNSALSEVPLDDQEQALLFHARTSDFQDVTVQATVSYRIADPALATTRIDFGIDPYTGVWNSIPLDTLGGLLTELAQQPAVERLARMTMRDALISGVGAVRAELAEALADDDRLSERGVAVTDVRVVAVRAEPDLERALQTETREQVQQEADRATYERRAVAVERERAIAENELQNEIELARRKEALVDQNGQNERRRATEEAAATAITAESDAARRRLRAQTEAEAMKLLGQAEAEALEARLGAYEEVDTTIVIALAIQDLAENLPSISSLTITPDLLTSTLAQLTGRAPAGLPGGEEL